MAVRKTDRRVGSMNRAPPLAPPAGGRGTESRDASSPLPLAGGVGGGPVTTASKGDSSGQFKPRDTARARVLRNQATPAERLLWRALSNRKVADCKFSRQMPVGPYFADFLCRSARLVVEVDGFSHDLRAEHDRRRDRFLIDEGLRVLRFSNEAVMANLEGVVQLVAAALAERCPPPTPPASGRGADGAAQQARTT